MALTRPHFENAPLNPAHEVDPCPVSDSDVFALDPTVRTKRSAPARFGHYELLEPIGEGQFGTVWRARDQRLDRQVALKIPHLADFDDHRRTLFLREARAAAALKHTNIVQVHGVDQEGDQPGIVSQYIKGQTLSQLIQTERPSFAEAARILSIVADAVHHAHEAGIIHRDLKPSNILMDPEGQPHVSDFGLAKWIGDQSLLTNHGIVLGTPAYMSPEQARGDSHLVDRRSDVYSLGVLLYELMTGKPPFEGNSTLLLHQIQSQDPRAPRSVDKTIPTDLETICLKCLAKEPGRRYPTASELTADLRRFLSGEPILARSISLAERSARWMRRNPMTAALIAVSILSTFAAVKLGIERREDTLPNQNAPILNVPQVVKPIIVSLNTEPEGATVVFYPLDTATGEPLIPQAVRPMGKSPVSVPLLPADYLIVTALPDGRFHEVYRHVPRDINMPPRFYPHCLWTVVAPNSISLHPVTIPPLRDESEMSLLANRNENETSSSKSLLNAFFLDKREVTVGEFLPSFNNQLPPSLRHRSELLKSLDLPITGLFFDEAMTHAELAGKRLPTASEYEFAATNGWTTLFPWGDTEPPSEVWQLSTGYKEFDETRTDSPVFGLFSNAAEFVHTGVQGSTGSSTTAFLVIAPESFGQIVRGGPIGAGTDTTELSRQGARWKTNFPRTLVSPLVGFRCAKSKSPRL